MQIRELDYQNQAVVDIISTLQADKSGRILLKQPTGTGKTIVIRKLIVHDNFISTLLEGKNRDYIRVVYKCHTYRLITQAKRRFDPYLVDESTLKNWADPNYTNSKRTEVIYQTYSEKVPSDVEVDIIIIDECQHESCNTYQLFLETAGKYPAIGMTATPDRPDNCLLKFDHIIEPLTRKEAVSSGYICNTDINTIVDSSSKNKIQLLKDILMTFNAEMKQTMIFVRTKAEVNVVVEYINQHLGEKAEGIVDCDDEDIDDILDRFSAGEYKFNVSCRKLGEGVDCAGVTDVILAQNVGSLTNLNQYIGRASRIDIPECRVWLFVNPLSGNNLCATDVVGIPKSHRLISRMNGKFIVRNFA